MITGTVNGRYEMLIKLLVQNSSGQEHEIETILDTGFNGSLTLPPSMIASFGLPWRSRSSAVLADGTIQQFDLHAAIVIWDGVPRAILVQAIDGEPLLGTALLIGFDLRVRVIIGGNVQIEAVP